MRYLGVLALSVALTSPAIARKHQSPKATASRQKLPPPPAAEPEPVAAAPTRVEPPRAAATAQENDDEIPGQKHKK